MFYQVFYSPQVKRCAIITCKYGVYELLHELPNDLKLSNFADSMIAAGRALVPTVEKKFSISGN